MDEHEVRHVVRSNGKEIWTRDELEAHRDFIRDICEKVKAANIEGFDLQATINRLLAFENEFPYLRQVG